MDCAPKDSRKTRRVRMGFNGLRSDEKMNAAPASTCLSAEYKASTSGRKRATANSGGSNVGGTSLLALRKRLLMSRFLHVIGWPSLRAV
jgi:hypothetical protein